MGILSTRRHRLPTVPKSLQIHGDSLLDESSLKLYRMPRAHPGAEEGKSELESQGWSDETFDFVALIDLENVC